MEHDVFGTNGRTEIQGKSVISGKGYKFKFRCVYNLRDINVQSAYTVHPLSSLPVGLVLHYLYRINYTYTPYLFLHHRPQNSGKKGRNAKKRAEKVGGVCINLATLIW